MELSQRGLELIQQFEGLRLRAYLDSAGVPTIGYGSTRGVQMGDEITETDALALLAADCDRFEDAVRELVNVRLNQNEFDALVSFSFNVGAAALRDSTLLRKLNAGEDREEVADEFLRWVYAGGKKLRGLERRRKAERDLFLKPVMPSSWYDEVDAEPGEGAP